MDGVADGGICDLGAVFGFVAAGEEVPKLDEALWGEDVFSGDGAGDGCGVDADDFCHVVHCERLEGLGAFF